MASRDPACVRAAHPGQFTSLAGVVVIARELSYGNSMAIPAIAETKKYEGILGETPGRK
jgi:hypothetical protein